MALQNELVKRGERLAAQFLKEKGYRILEINWRYYKNEVDIIALDGEVLVIAEVKTRRTAYFGNPEDAVTPAKANRLISAAEGYLEEKNLDLEVRYDIISIILSDKIEEIYHIKDAFFPADFA